VICPECGYKQCICALIKKARFNTFSCFIFWTKVYWNSLIWHFKQFIIGRRVHKVIKKVERHVKKGYKKK